MPNADTRFNALCNHLISGLPAVDGRASVKTDWKIFDSISSSCSRRRSKEDDSASCCPNSRHAFASVLILIFRDSVHIHPKYDGGNVEDEPIPTSSHRADLKSTLPIRVATDIGTEGSTRNVLRKVQQPSSRVIVIKHVRPRFLV